MKYCLRCQQTYPKNKLYCPADDSLLTLQDPYHLLGRTLGDRYLIEALIGMGGMGAVYSAHHQVLNLRVAFKILLPHLAVGGDHLQSLFTREARTASQLKHPNIVDVKDAGSTSDGIAYIVMEWLEGQNLEEKLRAAGPLGLDETLALLRQIGAALDTAHRQRIIHRDLKPSNIMLVPSHDGGDQVKVLDFGLAKILDDSVASVSAVMGTPHYASPEHFALGGMIDHRADLYSLGVMLYQLLSGELPFQGTQIQELVHLHRVETPTPLRLRRSSIPPGIEHLVMRLLAKSPDARPSSAGEVVRLFEQAIDTAEALRTKPHSSPVTSEKQPDPESNEIDVRVTMDQSMARMTVADPGRGTDIQNRQPSVDDAAVTTGDATPGVTIKPATHGNVIYEAGPGQERVQHAQIAEPVSPRVRKRGLVRWSLFAVAGITLIAVGIAFFWKSPSITPPPHRQPAETNVARSEDLRISLEIQGRNNAIQRVGLEPIESEDGFRFNLRAREAGYLYIISPDEHDVPMTWLTALPDPSTGVKTNFLPAGTDFVFPSNRWIGITTNETRMAFTFIFAHTPLTTPGFLAARAMRRLTSTDQHTLNELRQSSNVRAAELIIVPGDPEAKVVSNRPAAGTNDLPLIIEIPIRVEKRRSQGRIK